jgi:hypothetical protein
VGRIHHLPFRLNPIQPDGPAAFGSTCADLSRFSTPTCPLRAVPDTETEDLVEITSVEGVFSRKSTPTWGQEKSGGKCGPRLGEGRRGVVARHSPIHRRRLALCRASSYWFGGSLGNTLGNTTPVAGSEQGQDA